MTHYLQADLGANVAWECTFSHFLPAGDGASDGPLICFDLIKTEGGHLTNAPLPQLLIWKEPCFIPKIVSEHTPFLVASNSLIDLLTSFKLTPYTRHRIKLIGAMDSADDYALVVFEQNLAELTDFSETSIEVISLANPAEKSIAKGMCKHMDDFQQTMNKLIKTEAKMIRFQEYAIPGNHQVYGFGRNFTVISDAVRQAIEPMSFIGARVIPNKDFNIVNLLST